MTTNKQIDINLLEEFFKDCATYYPFMYIIIKNEEKTEPKFYLGENLDFKNNLNHIHVYSGLKDGCGGFKK